MLDISLYDQMFSDTDLQSFPDTNMTPLQITDERLVILFKVCLARVSEGIGKGKWNIKEKLIWFGNGGNELVDEE